MLTKFAKSLWLLFNAFLFVASTDWLTRQILNTDTTSVLFGMMVIAFWRISVNAHELERIKKRYEADHAD